MIGAILQQLRPKQWSKNLILFAGLIFAEQMRDPDLFISITTSLMSIGCGDVGTGTGLLAHRNDDERQIARY